MKYLVFFLLNASLKYSIMIKGKKAQSTCSVTVLMEFLKVSGEFCFSYLECYNAVFMSALQSGYSDFTSDM